MSRRITFAALAASIALIASGTLIATYAVADRECFEDSCRMQEAAEAKASKQSASPQAQAIEESVAPASVTNVSTIPDTVAPEPVAATPNANANGGEARVEAKREPGAGAAGGRGGGR